VTELKFHNTLTGKAEVFQPLEPGKIKMYVCGVTPYDRCHLGHGRCYVTFDFVRRSLKRLGYAVTCVQNFTDIDDKIIKKANESGETPSAVSERYIADYFDKMDKLNVQRADAYPRVTQTIPQTVAFIERLVKKGLAYPAADGVYYSVRKFPGYGKLSKRDLDDLRAGARVEVDDKKADPLDFALWKTAKPGEPSWDSPWGKGRPGWHIECSVMSMDTLKTETFDIHGGGLDLIFPHHENEIAQSEGCTDKPFARYWIHNGFVTVNKEKMSKSLGNFFTLEDILAKFEPRAVRLLLLSQHYRTPLEFSDDLLVQAAQGVKNMEDDLRRVTAALRAQHGTDGQDGKVLAERTEKFEKDFAAALADDFNAPEALAAIHALLGELKVRTATHRALHTGQMEKSLAVVTVALKDVFGLELSAQVDEGGDDVQALVNAREKARKDKDWKEADRLRAELTARNIVVEDTPQGARWWKKT
jgi:cysteinyl-tRNA synthetase